VSSDAPRSKAGFIWLYCRDRMRRRTGRATSPPSAQVSTTTSRNARRATATVEAGSSLAVCLGAGEREWRNASTRAWAVPGHQHSAPKRTGAIAQDRKMTDVAAGRMTGRSVGRASKNCLKKLNGLRMKTRPIANTFQLWTV
jgi:hypothetical protein